MQSTREFNLTTKENYGNTMFQGATPTERETEKQIEHL